MRVIVTSSVRMKTFPGPGALEAELRAIARRQPANPIYLVGGAVRDRILGRRSSDFDFAVREDAEQLARALERKGFGRAVRISSGRSPFPVWRLARPAMTVDIARFESAASIDGDLMRRDFTVNALALNVESGDLCDPCGGLADLRRRRVRMVSARNLDADPIRVLRAYRLAGELGWRIEAGTRRALAARARTVSRQPRERVNSEIARLFRAADGARPIGWAAKDGALKACLPLPRLQPSAVARLLAPFDGLPGDGRQRLFFRMAVLFFRAGPGPGRLPSMLAAKGFPRAERTDAILGARFLSAALSEVAPERMLFDFRDRWNELRPLLEIAVKSARETARARAVLSRARKCNFHRPPVDGRDIAAWLSLPPGKMLGRALDHARYLYFSGAARTRSQIERKLRSIDALPTVG
ncbi:MAG: hypothetical protein ACRD16_15040 [Thermoanaerobaculia bacterium]